MKVLWQSDFWTRRENFQLSDPAKCDGQENDSTSDEDLPSCDGEKSGGIPGQESDDLSGGKHADEMTEVLVVDDSVDGSYTGTINSSNGSEKDLNEPCTLPKNTAKPQSETVKHIQTESEEHSNGKGISSFHKDASNSDIEEGENYGKDRGIGNCKSGTMDNGEKKDLEEVNGQESIGNAKSDIGVDSSQGIPLHPTRAEDHRKVPHVSSRTSELEGNGENQSDERTEMREHKENSADEVDRKEMILLDTRKKENQNNGYESGFPKCRPEMEGEVENKDEGTDKPVHVDSTDSRDVTEASSVKSVILCEVNEEGKKNRKESDVRSEESIKAPQENEESSSKSSPQNNEYLEEREDHPTEDNHVTHANDTDKNITQHTHENSSYSRKIAPKYTGEKTIGKNHSSSFQNSENAVTNKPSSTITLKQETFQMCLNLEPEEDISFEYSCIKFEKSLEYYYKFNLNKK